MKGTRKEKWMKTAILLGIILVLLMGLAACGRKQAPQSPLPPQQKQVTEQKKPVPGGVQISTREISSQQQYYKVNLKIPVIQGLRDPKIQSDLNQKMALPTLTLRDQLGSQVKQYVQEAQKIRPVINPYELVSEYKLHTLRSNFLSLTVDNYEFTGGAHGNTQRLPFNFDLTSGTELALKDLFPADYDYKTPINQEIRKQIATHPQDFFQDTDGFQGITAQQTYYIENSNLVIYFGQYQIAPYSSGMPEFKIPFSMFNGKIDSRVS